MIELKISGPPSPGDPSLYEWISLLLNTLVSLAWPIALVFIVIVFRKPLLKLLERIKEVSGPGGTGAKFSEELAEGEQVAEEITGEPKSETRIADKEAEEENFNFLRLVEAHPEAAVLDAYKRVEAVFDAFRYGHFQRKSPRYIIEALHKQGYVSENVVGLYRKVAEIRNVAVHSGVSISKIEALAFADLCKQLTPFIEDALGKWEEDQQKKGKLDPRPPD